MPLIDEHGVLHDSFRLTVGDEGAGGRMREGDPLFDRRSTSTEFCMAVSASRLEMTRRGGRRGRKAPYLGVASPY